MVEHTLKGVGEVFRRREFLVPFREDGFEQCSADQLFAGGRLHPGGTGDRHRAAAEVEHRHRRVVDDFAAPDQPFPQ